MEQRETMGPQDVEQGGEGRGQAYAEAAPGEGGGGGAGAQPVEPGRAPGVGRRLADFALFRTMVSPVLIGLFCWFSTLAVILVSIYTIATGNVAKGVANLLIGPLVIRVLSEFLIVVFRINETLTEILRGRAET